MSYLSRLDDRCDIQNKVRFLIAKIERLNGERHGWGELLDVSNEKLQEKIASQISDNYWKSVDCAKELSSLITLDGSFCLFLKINRIMPEHVLN